MTTNPNEDFFGWLGGLLGRDRVPAKAVAALPKIDLENDPLVLGRTLAQKYPGRTSLTTAEAAFVLGRKPQTLLAWAAKQNGPIRPVKAGRRNLWKIEDLQRLAG